MIAIKRSTQFYNFVSIVGVLLLWQLVVSAGLFGKLVPSPVAVFKEFIDMLQNPIGGRSLFMHLWFSIKRVLTAFITAVVIGVPLGLFMGWNKKVDAIVKPVFELLKPIPPIAWIPLAILWFGIGETPKVFICFVGSFVPCVVNSYTGMRYVDPLLIDMTKTFGATRRQQFIDVGLPASLTAVFAGLQNALSLGWMCVLAAELVGAREGVGYIITLGMDTANPAMIIVGMLIIGAVGAAIAVIVRRIERIVCPWKRGITS